MLVALDSLPEFVSKANVQPRATDVKAIDINCILTINLVSAVGAGDVLAALDNLPDLVSSTATVKPGQPHKGCTIAVL